VKAPKQTTPARIREIVSATGRDRLTLARMLGYRSENSLRQAEAGKQTLSEDKVRWLKRYAQMRSRILKSQEMMLASDMESEKAWLEKNPPPGEKPA